MAPGRQFAPLDVCEGPARGSLLTVNKHEFPSLPFLAILSTTKKFSPSHSSRATLIPNVVMQLAVASSRRALSIHTPAGLREPHPRRLALLGSSRDTSQLTNLLPFIFSLPFLTTHQGAEVLITDLQSSNY